MSPMPARTYSNPGEDELDDYVLAANLTEVPPGRIFPVEVEGERIALYNVGGAIHATRDCCTHQSFPLSKGVLRGKYVKCALHGWEYDVTTGEYQGNPDIRVRRYSVKVEGDWIFVRVE